MLFMQEEENARKFEEERLLRLEKEQREKETLLMKQKL